MDVLICTAYVGLAIDTGRHKLYYTNEAGGGQVGEMSTDGTANRVLFSDVSSIPRGVVIDSENR